MTTAGSKSTNTISVTLEPGLETGLNPTNDEEGVRTTNRVLGAYPRWACIVFDAVGKSGTYDQKPVLA